MYKKAKKRYNKLSTRQKLVVGAGTAAVIGGALYYALRRNDWALYNYLIEKYKDLLTDSGNHTVNFVKMKDGARHYYQNAQANKERLLNEISTLQNTLDLREKTHEVPSLIPEYQMSKLQEKLKQVNELIKTTGDRYKQLLEKSGSSQDKERLASFFKE